MPYQALALHLGDNAELLVAGDFVIDAVQLPEVDALHIEAAQAHQEALAQVFGTAHRTPYIRPVTGKSVFGGDNDVSVGMEGFADQIFADIGAIRVGGVDEVDAEFPQASEDAQRFVTVFRLAPDTGTGMRIAPSRADGRSDHRRW